MQALLREYDPFPARRIRTATDYQREILRHVFGYQLRNIEDGTVIVYYSNPKGSQWYNKLEDAEKWLNTREEERLDNERVERPNTKWAFEGFFNVDVKVVLDRQPLVETGPLPDWLRNLAHSRAMVALDTYRDNLCLWWCLAVHLRNLGSLTNGSTRLKSWISLGSQNTRPGIRS